MIKELVAKNRSYRRYDAGYTISRQKIEGYIDIARLCASAANKQPLRYYIACDDAANNLIFPNLKWAAMLKGWSGPTKNERPSAYVIILSDKSLWTPLSVHDIGIAAQTLLLAAAEDGLGGCMISNFAADVVRIAIQCGSKYEPQLIIALGKPAETIILEDTADGKTHYYRDEYDYHHVPKRSLKEVIIN